MNKLLLDSNIIIGAIKGRVPILFFSDYELYVSQITRLEVLGYHKMTDPENVKINRFFSNTITLEIDNHIINLAIKFRQNKKMSLGDSIIAATAICHDLPLATANTIDFNHIENLEAINPIATTP